MINILIVDDNKTWRDTLKLVLSNGSIFNICGECTDGDEVLPFLKLNENIDIIITDINMKRINGLKATKLIKEKYPEIHVIGHSMYSAKKYSLAMKEAGASAYITKGIATNEFIAIIKQIGLRA